MLAHHDHGLRQVSDERVRIARVNRFAQGIPRGRRLTHDVLVVVVHGDLREEVGTVVAAALPLVEVEGTGACGVGGRGGRCCCCRGGCGRCGWRRRDVVGGHLGFDGLFDDGVAADLGMEGPQRPAVADGAGAAAEGLDVVGADGGIERLFDLSVAGVGVGDGEIGRHDVPEPDVVAEVVAPGGAVGFAEAVTPEGGVEVDEADVLGGVVLDCGFVDTVELGDEGVHVVAQILAERWPTPHAEGVAVAPGCICVEELGVAGDIEEEIGLRLDVVGREQIVNGILKILANGVGDIGFACVDCLGAHSRSAGIGVVVRSVILALDGVEDAAVGDVEELCVVAPGGHCHQSWRRSRTGDLVSHIDELAAGTCGP